MGWIVPTAAGSYRVNWRDPAGKQRSKTVPTKREAKAFLAQVDADTARGNYVDPTAGRRVLLRDLAADWLAGRTVELSTDERTRSVLRVHVLPRWGDWPLTRIDHVSVQQWVRELSDQRAPLTVAKCVNVLSLVLGTAVRARLLAVNPCDGLMLPSARRTADAGRAITRDEFRGKLLPQIPDAYRPLVCLAAGCGLRWGECAGLSWDAVDLSAAQLAVRQVAVEVTGRMELRPYAKTRAGRRVVPIPRFALDALGAARPSGELAGRLVVATRTGAPLRRSNFRRVWVAAVERSGLGGLRFHDLRHSYATWLVSDGVPVNVVARLLGHQQISTTLNRYTHDARDYADGHVRRVFDDLDADDDLDVDDPDADNLLTPEEE